jgi:hypothetical protein
MGYTEIVEKLKTFIADNKLDFSGDDSSLNGTCTVLAGYMLYLNEDITRNIAENCYTDLKLPNDYSDTFKYSIFKTAKKRNYGNFWRTNKANEMYKF